MERTDTLVPPAKESLQYSLGFMLNAASRTMNRLLVQKLSPFGITPSQYITLWALWESREELPVSQLGKRLMLDNPTMTGIIDRMERDGLIERVPDETDRRIIKVRLTEKSNTLRAEIKDFGPDIDTDKAQFFGADLFERMLDFLKHITNNGNQDKSI